MLVPVLFALACTTSAALQPLKTYTINLDLPPEQRYLDVIQDSSNNFNATVWEFYNKYFANDKILTDVLYGISDHRGPEPGEMQGEIQGLSTSSGLPLKFVQSIQMLYELQTLMVPVANFTHKTAHSGLERIEDFINKAVDEIPEVFSALKRLPWRGPGCTGIIARNADDNTVYHARNLDFAPLEIMNKIVYIGIFEKGGKEVFRSQMVAGYTMPITALKAGPDGYAVERNTRYTNHFGGNSAMIKNLLGGRPLNGWQLRQTLENVDTFDAAVAQLKTIPYASTEYSIVSGVQKGVIISRDPDGVAYLQTLGQDNFEEPKDYIIMTNFDFFFHDVREYFDPTGHGGFGKPTRRIQAQKMLNATLAANQSLTPERLYEVINAEYVIADTVFQAIINVEKGLFNVSQPNL